MILIDRIPIFGGVISSSTESALSDSDAWTAAASWYSKQDAPLSRYINELTLQINESRVRPGDYIKGRIIFDVAKPLNGMNSQNLILLEDRRDQRRRARVLGHREFEVNSEQVMDKKIRLPPGRQAMRFCIRVPEDEFHSFTYVSPTDGSTIINHNSIETTARVNGITESTNRLTFHVLSVNDFEGPIGLVDSNNFIPRKFVRRTDGLSFALAQTSDGYYPQYENIEAVVLRRMRIPLTGEEKEERVTPTITLLPQSSPAESSVVGEYRKKTHNAKVPSKFTQYFERRDLKLPPLLPSVWCEDFMCDYYLRIDADGTAYEAPFAIIDNFEPKAHNHCLNPETANATTFKIVGQQF
ncbi:unnamed protein product [Dibothriocephalus latus]|uniref:Arrestin-like N-terminal domain-containing protein n=1 Tax=Dibothriocephalus latus TaxID=60516 RepID=A0A3P6TQH4_DIBLA|nr:unnamed protein product [Dibothriocephalus latus]